MGDQDHTKELLAEIRQELIRIGGGKVGIPDEPTMLLTLALGALQKIYGPKEPVPSHLPPHIRPDESNPGIYMIDSGQIDRADGDGLWGFLDTRGCAPGDLDIIADHMRTTSWGADR